MAGTVAAATAQPTATGREIHRLAVQGRALVEAFGDWDGNHGPLAEAPLDLDTLTFVATETTLTAEALWTMRLYAGVLYCVFIDPQGTNSEPDNGQLAIRAADGIWSVITTITGLTHGFDFAITSEGWWVFGSNETGDLATVWLSTDEGVTWSVEFTVAGDGSGQAHFYAACHFGDTIIAYYGDNAGVSTYLHEPDGGWDEIDAVQIGETPCPFSYNGTDFWVGLDVGKSSPVVSASPPRVIVAPADGAQHDAILASLPDITIYDAASDGTNLWLLASDGQVWRGDTAGNWTSTMTLTDHTVRSIAVDVEGGNLWFGNTASQLLDTPIPA